jgi:hypothetical protein
MERRMIDRRNFLRGLVMSVTASGLILPTSAQALVLGDRYQRLVTSLRAIIDGNKIYQNIDGLSFSTITAPDGTPLGRAVIADTKEARRERTAAWQAYKPQYQHDIAEMFRVLAEDFGDMTAWKVDPEGTTRRVAQIIYDPEMHFDILDENELRQHEDIIVAVATLRILLTRYRVSTEGVSKSPHFKTFLIRYRDMIFNASEKDLHETRMRVGMQAR